MNKISSIAQRGRGGKAIEDRPNDDLEMALAAPKGLNLGRRANLQDVPENQVPAKDGVVLGELATSDHSIELGTENASSLPALLDAPVESFTMLAQAPASTTTSSGGSSAGFFETASATQIGAVALGLVAVGVAASSGGSDSPKVVPAPAVAVAAATGVITVTLGGDAASAKLFAGSVDITSKFTSSKSGQVVTFTPLAGQVEFTAQPITAKGADSAGLSSADSAPVVYSFDNVPPAAPVVTAAAATGVITVAVATTSDAASTKLLTGTADITSKFTSAVSGSTVTFTPVKGQVEFSSQAVTATVADAAKNMSAASTAITYSFDNVAPAAPTVTAAAATGVITVALAPTSDAATAKLFVGSADVTSNFTAAVSGSTVTYTPIAGKVELAAQGLTATVADAAKNVSAASAAVTYSFDNVPPAAPTVTAAAATGVITVALAATSDAASTKLLAGAADITSKFTSGVSGSTVTFTPVKGQVEFTAQAVTATAADAAKNVSAASAAVTYSFDNVPPAAPSLAAGAVAGTISVTAAADVAAFNILSNGVDASDKFDIQVISATQDLLVPKALAFDGKTQSITLVALDKASNASPVSTALTYSFDNVPPVAAPAALVADSKTGVITMSVGADATTAKLFAGAADITSSFSSKATGSALTFTPLAGKVEYAAQAIDVKASDAAGNLSTASTKLATYSFDNVAPPAPNSIVLNATNGNVTVSIGTIGAPVASTVKLLLGTTDITNKYVADTTVAGQVTFVPVAGQVLPSNQTLTATVADAAGNASVESSPSGPTPTLNLINITAESASKAPSGGFPASGANYLFTVDTSTSYGATVTQFAAGDQIVFKGDAVPTINFKNTNTSDNQVTIAATAGSNAVELTLTNLPSGADSGLFGLVSFNNFFGAGSLSFASKATPETSSTQAINDKNFAGPTGQGFDAAGSSVAYTISEGTFASTIANFASGDSIAIVGKGAAASLNFANSNVSDGSVIITSTFDSGSIAQLTLKGLAPADDAQIFGKDSFLKVFGSGSLTVSGQAGSKAVDVTATNNGGQGGFDASSGDFAFNIGVGEYKTTINGFGSGDSLSFFGSKVATLGIKNTNFSDGVVLVTGLVDGQLVEVTLGVATSLDGNLFGVNAFNATFGASSLIA